MLFSSLNHFKLGMTSQIFIRPADENYIQARWLFLNGFENFYWQAAQTLEKYLKASLVLNGYSVIESKHNLISLFTEYKKNYGELALSTFAKPDDFPVELWQQKAVETFILQIDSMGHADSRYGLTNWAMCAQDLIMLDISCSHLRRLIIGLDWIVGKDIKPTNSIKKYIGVSYRDALMNDPDAVPISDIKNLSTPIIDIGESREKILSAWNFTNFEGRGMHKTPVQAWVTSPMGKAANSYLYSVHRILQKTDSSGRMLKLPAFIHDGVVWLIENVMIGKQARLEFERLLKVKRY